MNSKYDPNFSKEEQPEHEELVSVDEVHPLAPFETISWQIGDLVSIPNYEELKKFPFRSEKLSLNQKQEQIVELAKEQTKSLLSDDELAEELTQQEPKQSEPKPDQQKVQTPENSNVNPNPQKESKKFEAATRLLLRYANVYCTKTLLDIQWQDGTLTKSVASAELVPMQTVMEEDFWPGDFIISKKKEEKKTGIVTSFSHKDKTADVVWFADHGKTEITEQKDVPIFNFVNHEGYGYTLGDIVIKLETDNKAQDPNVNNEKKKKGSKKDISKCLDWIGYVVGIGGTQVIQTISGKTLIVSNAPKPNEMTIIWANDTITNTPYDEILKLEIEDETEFEELDDDQYQYDTLDEEDGQQEPGLTGTGPGEMPSVFSQPFEKTSWWFETEEGSHELKSNVITSYKTSNNNSQKEEFSENEMGPIVQVPTEYSKEIFIPFEALISKPTQHKFYTGSHEVSPSIEFYKAIVSEWAILQKNLPFGIFVKAYEEEIQCLSAMIIGPQDTP